MDSPLSPYVLAVTSTSGRCCDERGHEREERTVWVAFRGTDNTKDVLTDAKIIPGKMNIGYVHSGFLDRIKALGKQIESLYEWASAQNSNLKPSEPIVRVIFTGHSLGGAMAQVALLHVWAERDLNACRHEHVGAIAFGSPLVGNRRMFGKLRELALNDRILNVVHTDDILPILLNYAM
ncbi:Alpha/Beta hydrolase protein, partial [Zopfochytrium polystomum]